MHKFVTIFKPICTTIVKIIKLYAKFFFYFSIGSFFSIFSR